MCEYNGSRRMRTALPLTTFREQVPRVLLMMLVRALEEGQSLLRGVKLSADRRVSSWQSAAERDSSRSLVGNPSRLRRSVDGLNWGTACHKVGVQ